MRPDYVEGADYDRLADEVERITFDPAATPELLAYADLAADLLAAYDSTPRVEPDAADVLELLM